MKHSDTFSPNPVHEKITGTGNAAVLFHLFLSWALQSPVFKLGQNRIRNASAHLSKLFVLLWGHSKGGGKQLLQQICPRVQLVGGQGDVQTVLFLQAIALMNLNNIKKAREIFIIYILPGKKARSLACMTDFSISIFEFDKNSHAAARLQTFSVYKK